MRTISRHAPGKRLKAALLLVAAIGSLVMWMTFDPTGNSVSTSHPTWAPGRSAERPLIPGESPDPALELLLSQTSPENGKAPWKHGCFRNDGDFGRAACINSDGRGALSNDDHAVSFPANGEGKAILRVEHDVGLDPGDRDFKVAATVSVTAEQVAANSNVIQKGHFYGNDGQWKLQVDNGKPSCRIAGERDGSPVDVVVVADDSIAGEGFVALECQRRGAHLMLTVDDQKYTSGQDATMNIKSSHPVTVGGKGNGKNNDQLHGKLKHVGLTIG